MSLFLSLWKQYFLYFWPFFNIAAAKINKENIVWKGNYSQVERPLALHKSLPCLQIGGYLYQTVHQMFGGRFISFQRRLFSVYSIKGRNILYKLKAAFTEKAGLPTRDTGADLLPELKYNHRENRLEQVSDGNPLWPVFLIDLFIPVSRPRANLLENGLVLPQINNLPPVSFLLIVLPLAASLVTTTENKLMQHVGTFCASVVFCHLPWILRS